MIPRRIAFFAFVGLTGAFFSFLLTAGKCLFAQQGQYQMQGSQGMQGSQELQDFKAQQQQKAQQYLAQYEKENKEFMNTLWAMQRNEKISALKDFISKQCDKNAAFRQQRYEEQRAFFGQRLDANPNMQPFMKEKMLARMDQDYEEMKAFFAGKLQEDMAFLDGLLKDASIDGQELNAELQKFFQAQNADAQEFLQNQQQKYQNRQGASLR